MTHEEIRQVGGIATRVVTSGSGAPILWLHDSFGNRPVEAQARLAERYTVIAPTLPGFEDKESLGGIDTPEDVVLWLREALHDLGLLRPVLLGCGFGGWMAAELAVWYPNRLSGLVLVDAYGLRVDGALAADEFALTPPMLRPLLFADPDGPLAREWLPDVDPPERLERTLRAGVGTARLAWQFPYNRKLRERLRRAHVPALVLWGERDGLVPVAHAGAFVEALPQARAVVFEGIGHYPYLEAPERFTDEVERFMGETERRRNG